MTVPDKIKVFLSDIKGLSLGYSELNFFLPDSLVEEQIGYSIDAKGKSLITGKEGDWKSEWLVIATDNVGDPIIVDTNSPNFPILTAAHGEGEWEPVTIAESFEKFIIIIASLDILSNDRRNPVEFENNPISVKERQNLLTKIAEQNPNAELSYWVTFLEED